MEEQIEKLAFINPDTGRVMNQLNKLLLEWKNWKVEVHQIKDHPFDRNVASEVMADGIENMNYHDILQTKTLTFLNNNIIGHGFIKGMDGKQCDRNDLRLKVRVDHRIHNLAILIASLEYANVPDAFWKIKSKELLNKVIDKSSDETINMVAGYLKNPISI